MTDRILREQEVAEVTGLSRTTRWRMVQDGRFPPPLKLTSRNHGWLKSDIDQWLEGLREMAEAGR